jgi:hypothetical protein
VLGAVMRAADPETVARTLTQAFAEAATGVTGPTPDDGPGRDLAGGGTGGAGIAPDDGPGRDLAGGGTGSAGIAPGGVVSAEGRTTAAMGARA